MLFLFLWQPAIGAVFRIWQDYSLAYTISCLAALYALSHFTKNRVVLIAAFTIILYAPCSYDAMVQFVYNISFTSVLMVWTISSLMIAYQKREESRGSYVFWCIMAAIGSMAIWLNREDSVWIVPLLSVFVVIILFSVCRYRKKGKMKAGIGCIILAFVPILAVAARDLALRCINYNGYGVFVTNDCKSTNFDKAYNSLLKIRQNYFPESCSITRETIDAACRVSPSMNELKGYLDKQYESNQGMVIIGRNIEDGEIEDGWMNVILRETAGSSGYYRDAVETDQYWGRVHEELEEAFKQGKLESRPTFFWGTVLHHSWRKNAGYFEKWMVSAGTMLKEAVKHQNIKAELRYNAIEQKYADRYEAMTLNYSVAAPGEYIVKASGWLFVENLNHQYKLKLVDQTSNVLQNIEYEESTDLVQGYGNISANIDKCRFSFQCQIKSGTELYLSIIDQQKKEYARVRVKNGAFGKDIKYHFDVLDYTPVNVDAAEDFAVKRIEMANRIGTIYQKTGPIAFAISIAVYLFMSTRLIMTIKNKKYQFLDEWIFESAILGCGIVLLLALSYIDAFMWAALWYSENIPLLLNFLYAVNVVVIYRIYKSIRCKYKPNYHQ